jgi:phosphohistidine phosphatase
MIMKTVILIRHAKSSRKFPELKDIERPLRKRGIKAAALMADVLKGKQLAVDQIISSPAVRSVTTAKSFAQKLGLNEADIVIDSALYMESKNKLLKRLGEVEDRFNTVIFVSHNPALTDFANLLMNQSIDNIPTSGMVAIRFASGSWKEIEKKKGEQLFFEIPRKHKKKSEKAKSEIL